MKTFLQKTSESIIAKHGSNLSHVHVILPTHRACYFFRHELLQQQQTLWLPKIQTLSDWVEEISGLQRSNTLEEIILLHQINLNIGQGETLDEFIPLGRTLCSDFEEMDMHLVRTDWFFRQLRNLASMKVYEPATTLTSSQIDYLKFWERFEQLYEEHRTQLLQQKKGNNGTMFRKVAEEIETLSEHFQNIYFIGFDGLTKAEETIIKHLHTHGKATVFWDADSYYVEHNAREAGYFFRKYFTEWKGDMQFTEQQIISEKKQIEIISVARSVGQAKVATEIIKSHLELTNENAINTAIILPEEKLLQPLQYFLPASLGKYNLTMGLPISRSLSGELLMLLFRLHESAERFKLRSKKHKLYHKDLIALFQHPFFDVFAKGKNLHEIIREIRAKNIVFISRNFFEKHEIDLGEGLLNFLFHSDDSKTYLQQIESFTNTLIQHFHTQKKQEIELEFLIRISDLLQTIFHLLQNTSLKPKTLRALLNDEFKNHRVPFEGEPAEGLQIMGLMESRCLDFENVIILSTNEGVIPSGKSNKSYIPHPLRNAAMFSHVHKDAKTAYLFYRLLHKAKKIFLLYDTEGNNLGGGEKSRFILQLQYELAKEAKNICIKESVYSVASPEPKPSPAIEVTKSETIAKKVEANIANGLSPSALSTFINCSLQYYFRYIANLKEPDEVEENMENKTMGTAIHHVLEELYKPKIGKYISAEWVEELRNDKQRIAELLKEGFKARFDEESLMQGKNHLQYRLSLKMIDSFLKNEIERLNKGEKVRIEALEKPLETLIEVNGKQIKIKGIADRIEWQNDILTIVDFKSGKAKSVELKAGMEETIAKDPELRVQFQLFTYAWTYHKMQPQTGLPLQSGIFWLQKTNEGFDKLSLSKQTLLCQEHFGGFEEKLQELLEQLLNKDENFKQTDEIERCEYCAYKRICRR